MNLTEIYREKSKKKKLSWMIALYILDKVIIVAIVTLGIFLLQHQIEQMDYERQHQSEKQDLEMQIRKEKDEKIAQVINAYSSEIMNMSTDLDEIDHPLSDETLWTDYEKASSAIETLLIQESLNKNAFAPYSAEIAECEEAVDGYCNFIMKMLDPDSNPVGSLGEYSVELKKHHGAIQSSCIKLSNHCSDVMYGFE